MKIGIELDSGRRIEIPAIVEQIARVAQVSEYGNGLPELLVLRPLTIDQARDIQSFVRDLLIGLRFTPEPGVDHSLPSSFMPVRSTARRLAQEAYRFDHAEIEPVPAVFSTATLNEALSAAGSGLARSNISTTGGLAHVLSAANRVVWPNFTPDVDELPAANSVPSETRVRLLTDGKVYESNGETWSAYSYGNEPPLTFRDTAT